MMSKKDAAILALQLSLQSFGDILYRWMPTDGWKDYIKICVNEEYTNRVLVTAFSALVDGSGKKISDMNGKDFKFCHQKKWVGGKNVLFYLLHPQTKNTDYKPDEPKNTAGWQEIIDGYPNYLPKRKKPDRGQQQKGKKKMTLPTMMIQTKMIKGLLKWLASNINLSDLVTAKTKKKL